MTATRYSLHPSISRRRRRWRRNNKCSDRQGFPPRLESAHHEMARWNGISCPGRADRPRRLCLYLYRRPCRHSQRTLDWHFFAPHPSCEILLFVARKSAMTTTEENKLAGRRAHALFQSSIHGPWGRICMGFMVMPEAATYKFPESLFLIRTARPGGFRRPSKPSPQRARSQRKFDFSAYHCSHYAGHLKMVLFVPLPPRMFQTF